MPGSSATLQTFACCAFFSQEIEAVLVNVTQRNNYRQSLAAKRHNFDAWRQVAEVVLMSCPAEVLPPPLKQKVVVELLQDLLSKVCPLCE